MRVRKEKQGRKGNMTGAAEGFPFAPTAQANTVLYGYNPW
jgi:hypothetical protein